MKRENEGEEWKERREDKREEWETKRENEWEQWKEKWAVEHKKMEAEEGGWEAAYALERRNWGIAVASIS